MSADEPQTDRDLDVEGIEMWSDSAIRRLDHVYDTLETIASHANDQATIDAVSGAKEMLEETQSDLHEIEEEIHR